MRIKSVSLTGFRGYSEKVTVDIENICVLVGKNDIGKSTLLEALDIFFNDGKGCVKIDKDDINKQFIEAGRNTIEISVEFESLPERIVIDATNATTLSEEYLLTDTGALHVTKKFLNAGKEKIFIEALHPTNALCKDLLLKKNSELKKIVGDQNLDCLDRTKNAELRKTIWQGQADVQLETIEIEIAKIDSKAIWEQLKSHMPVYTLFQSDRKNSDGDSEVQDPIRIAVKEILENNEIKQELANVASTVRTKLEEVVSRTLGKLREMNPDIANSLDPKLPETESLKWADVFKSVSITGDEQIPINKRGSGVKRLILISFFRAEAERRREVQNLQNIVYAIEEPETSQHPQHQRALIDALLELSRTDDAQVIVTTHSPEIVKRLEFNQILLIAGQKPGQINQVREHELPYPSLNEVNFSAFDEPSAEYHNELYGYIEAEGRLNDYKSGKTTRPYNRERNGSVIQQNLILTEYIRHQIHHPENDQNTLFTETELDDSITFMRDFIQKEIRP